MVGVLYGHQWWSRARMLALTAASTFAWAVAWAVLALPSAQGQGIFNFAPAALPPDDKPAAQITVPIVEEVAAARRSAHRKNQARRVRATDSVRYYSRETTRDADRDLPKDGQQSSLGARVNNNTIAVLSGNLDATSTAIVAELSALLDDGDNLRILPVIGKGGGQNIRDVRFMKGVDLGITRANLLNAYKRGNQIGPIDDKIVYIAKLFDEEMHVLVRADSPVTAIEQLSGQRVNFGALDSGTELTTRDVFARLGIKAVEVNSSQAEALQKLRKGEIAATVQIAGKPAAALSQLSAEGFRLLPVPYTKELHGDFLPASLGSQDYPALVGPQRPIDTVAVPAVLIAYNWPKDSDRYRRIEKFVEAFFSRLADFQQPPRHPKWREASLATALPGWKRFAAAEDWLQRARPQVRNDGNPSDKFMTALDVLTGSGSASASESDHLFQEFLKWHQARERR